MEFGLDKSQEVLEQIQKYLKIYAFVKNCLI